MDLALALEKINPKWGYVLNHSQADGKQLIVEWRGPGEKPGAVELANAWALCLEDIAIVEREERERQEALARMKADPEMADVLLVLKL